MPNGTYALNLYFSENSYSKAGKRVFDIAIEGLTAISTLDIYKLVGKNAPLVKTYTTTVSDGTLDISFIGKIGSASIAAIDVSAAPPITTRINVGGAAFSDAIGQKWLPDSYFTGGALYSTTANIPGTTDDILYQTERYGTSLSYRLPVANGNYEVILHFAEIYFTAAGKRVFNVTIEGSLVASNLDIWALIGSNGPLVRTYTKAVSDGYLDIGFSAVKDNAKISAIEVRKIP